MAISPTTASTLPPLLISTAPLRAMAALWAAVTPPRLSSPSPPGSVQQRHGCAEQHLKGGGCCCFGTMAAPLHPCLCGAGRPLHPFSCLATWLFSCSGCADTQMGGRRLVICTVCRPRCLDAWRPCGLQCSATRADCHRASARQLYARCLGAAYRRLNGSP